MAYNITLEEKGIMNRFKNKNKHVCAYCGKTISNKDELTVDHKVPLSRGGITTDENLAISCLQCNSEKSDMTDEEYAVLKKKQQELCDSLEMSGLLESLFSTYDLIIEKAGEINSACAEAEREIVKIENEIASSKFNASEGYVLAKRLKEAVINRNVLRNRKMAYNSLHSFAGSSKKQLMGTKKTIVQSLLASSYNDLKQICIRECQAEKETKVIQIGEMRA